MTESASVLEVRDLTVRFGGLVAVNGVSVACQTGSLTGLIGPNGAGKSTLIDAVTGFLPRHATGSVLLDGEEVFGRPPHTLAHAGLRRTWQSMQLFDDISVLANLEVASRHLTLGGAFLDFFRPRERDESVEQAVEMLGLGDVVKREPRELSHGRRKMVGVGRALVGGARVLLLDEPAAGLDRAETSWFGDQLRRLVDRGASVLLVDHDMQLVLKVSDTIHVLEFGESIASGTPAQIRSDPRVVAAYLGRHGDPSDG